MKKLKVRWIAIDGSIFTEEKIVILKVPKSTENPNGTVPVRESIAFNVGDEAAKHIVNLHNHEMKFVETW